MYCLEKLQRELAYFFDMDLRELPRVQDLLAAKGYTQVQKGDEIITLEPSQAKKPADKAESNLSQEIKDIIDSSPEKGRDMQIIGEANFTPQVVEYAHKNNKKVAIDKLEQTEAEKLGFKHPQDVRVTIDYQAINHTLNRHGADSALVQQSRQKAVDYTDIAEYRSIVKGADESLDSVDNLGQEVVVSFKQINGHAAVVESIRKKGNELAFKSMYFENGSYKNSNAYKNAVESPKGNPSPAPYGYEPHADASTPPKVDTKIIPQSTATLSKQAQDHAHQILQGLRKTAQTPLNKLADEVHSTDRGFMLRQARYMKQIAQEFADSFANLHWQDLRTAIRYAKVPYNEAMFKELKESIESKEFARFIESSYPPKPTQKSLFDPPSPTPPKPTPPEPSSQAEVGAAIHTDTPKLDSSDIIFTDKNGKEHTLTQEVQEQWLNTFNLKSLDESYTPKHSDEILQALGGKEIKLQLGSLKKLVAQGREQYIPQIKEVLDSPEAILKDSDNAFLFARHLKDDDYFVNVSVDKGEYLVSISNGIKETSNIKNKLDSGAEVVYQSPNANSNLQTLLQASRYSANKIDSDIIPQSTQEKPKWSRADSKKWKLAKLEQTKAAAIKLYEQLQPIYNQARPLLIKAKELKSTAKAKELKDKAWKLIEQESKPFIKELEQHALEIDRTAFILYPESASIKIQPKSNFNLEWENKTRGAQGLKGAAKYRAQALQRLSEKDYMTPFEQATKASNPLTQLHALKFEILKDLHKAKVYINQQGYDKDLHKTYLGYVNRASSALDSIEQSIRELKSKIQPKPQRVQEVRSKVQDFIKWRDEVRFDTDYLLTLESDGVAHALEYLEAKLQAATLPQQASFITQLKEQIKEHFPTPPSPTPPKPTPPEPSSQAEVGAAIHKDTPKLDSSLAYTDTQGHTHQIPEPIAQKWLETFGLKDLQEPYTPKFSEQVAQALEPILQGESIKLYAGSLIKLIKENRLQYLDRIQPTLEQPQRVILQNDGALIFARNFGDEKYFTSVARNDDGEWIIRSTAQESESGLDNKIAAGGREIYNSQAATQINAHSPYDDIAKSNTKLDSEIIPQPLDTLPTPAQNLIKKLLYQIRSLEKSPSFREHDKIIAEIKKSNDTQMLATLLKNFDERYPSAKDHYLLSGLRESIQNTLNKLSNPHIAKVLQAFTEKHPNPRNQAQAVKELYHRYGTPELKGLFDKVLSAAGDVKFSIRQTYANANGKYFADKHLITLNRRWALDIEPQRLAQTLLHELIHATIARAQYHRFSPQAYPELAHKLTPAQKAAVQEIDNLYILAFKTHQAQKRAKTLADDELDFYGFTNSKEFVAELANPKFRSYLEKQNIFKRVLEAIVKFFTGGGGEQTNILKALQESYEKYLDNFGERSESFFGKKEGGASPSEPSIAKTDEQPQTLKSKAKTQGQDLVLFDKDSSVPNHHAQRAD